MAGPDLFLSAKNSLLRKEPSMKKIAALLCTLLLGLGLFTGCSLLDHGTTSDEMVSISIEAEPASIANLKPELDELAHQYDPDGYMVGAVVTYQGNEAVDSRTGTINFTYFSQGEETQTATVLSYDMASRQVTEISYKDRSHVDVSQEAINEQCIAVSFDSLFTMLENDSSFGSKLDGANITLTITFDHEAITPSLI